jgi:DNA-binding transcriptional ArsR family regulator
MIHDPFGALADPTRRTIFELLASEGPRAVSDIARSLPVSRPAVSQHLKILVEAGLVRATAHGTRRIYRVDGSGLEVLRAWLEGHWDFVFERFEHAARREAVAMTTHSVHAPVRKTCTVPLTVEAAFDLFTHRIAEWWPVDTHSISGDRNERGRAHDVADVRFDGRVGGRVTEVAADGTEYSWADVLAWDPPNRFVLSWHPNVAPTAASRVEVRFRPVEAGTQVLLEHSGWEEFGARGAELRERYAHGWGPVLERFTTAADPAPAR